MSRCSDCAPEYTECWNDATKCRKRSGSFAAPIGSAYDSFKSAIESGDIEHLLWWSATARALLKEVVQQHADKDAPEYNECDAGKCSWCEKAEKLMPNDQAER